MGMASVPNAASSPLVGTGLFLGFALYVPEARALLQPARLPKAVSPELGDGGATFTSVRLPFPLVGGVQLAPDDWLTCPGRAIAASCCWSVAACFSASAAACTAALAMTLVSALLPASFANRSFAPSSMVLAETRLPANLRALYLLFPFRIFKIKCLALLGTTAHTVAGDNVGDQNQVVRWYIGGQCHDPRHSPGAVHHTAPKPHKQTQPLGNTVCNGAAKPHGTQRRCQKKGEVRLECAAALHLMRNKRWETPIDECVHKGGMEEGRVARQLWVDVCRKWWTNFSAMCVFPWHARWFAGGDLKRLREYSIAMGEAHLQLRGGNCSAPTCG